MWHTSRRMSKVVPISISSQRSPDHPPNDRGEKTIDAIRMLVSTLSREEQNRLLTDLVESVRPIPAPRAGEVLGAIVKLLPRQRDWMVDDIRKRVAGTGVGASPKEIYNAIGCVARKGH